jgi:hypothetical protein
MTAGKLAKAIVSNVYRKIDATDQHFAHRPGTTVGERFAQAFGRGADAVLRDLARQTKLEIHALKVLPVSELLNHLGPLGSTTGPVPSRMARTVVCATANGSTTCGTVGGIEEGILWGSLVGGVIGGGAGAAIGAAIGALIDWLFGDDDDD